MRLFVALPIPEEVREHLKGVITKLVQAKQAALADVRWVRPANLHMTLKFLGEVSEADIPGIEAALRGISSSGPMTTRAERIVVEPRQGAAHLIATDITGDAVALRRLQEGVAQTMEALCFAPEPRGFWPHITLGRSQKGVSFGPREPTDSVLTALSGAQWPGREGTVNHFDLMSSKPSAEGPVYETLKTFAL